MPKKSNYPPFEPLPEVEEIGYRVEFKVTCFVKGNHISPQRLEDAIQKTIEEHDSFAIVRNISIIRSTE